MDELVMYYREEANTYANRNRYGLEIYQYATKRYLTFLAEFKTRLNYHKGTDTTYLVHLYRDAIKEAIDLTDSLKKLESLKLLEPDKETWYFTDHENLKLVPENSDYGLLLLVYLHDFETQILKAVSIVHPNYGCLKITPYSFQDFMIIQNHSINEKSYFISVQNNFLYRQGLEEYHIISFKSLQKINQKDTLPLHVPITFSEKNKVYKTNAIPYEKGNYLLTLNLNYELPSGAIKIHEMKFEYELK